MSDQGMSRPNYLPPNVRALAYAGPDLRPHGRVGSFLARPVGWTLVIAAALTMATTLYADGVPTEGLFGLELVVAAAAWVVVGFAWFCRAIATAAAARRPVGTDDERRGRWRWAVVPTLFVLTITLCEADVPTAVVFRLSRPAMERSALAALARPARAVLPMGVGLYGTSTPEIENGTVYFPITGTGFFDQDGYGYNAAGPPAPGHGSCRHLSGPWYRYRRHLPS